VEIVVRDSGEGISPEFVPTCFERFRQADSSNHAAPRGSAWASRSCATWSKRTGDGGGRERRQGQGSSFTVHLPRHAAVDEAAAPGQAAPAEAAPVRSLEHVRVLLVETIPTRAG